MMNVKKDKRNPDHLQEMKESISKFVKNLYSEVKRNSSVQWVRCDGKCIKEVGCERYTGGFGKWNQDVIQTSKHHNELGAFVKPIVGYTCAFCNTEKVCNYTFCTGAYYMHRHIPCCETCYNQYKFY